MDDLLFGMFVREQILNDFVEVLLATDDPNDSANQRDAARCVGLDWSTLSSDEIKYLEDKINGNV